MNRSEFFTLNGIRYRARGLRLSIWNAEKARWDTVNIHKLREAWAKLADEFDQSLKGEEQCKKERT